MLVQRGWDEAARPLRHVAARAANGPESSILFGRRLGNRFIARYAGGQEHEVERLNGYQFKTTAHA